MNSEASDDNVSESAILEAMEYLEELYQEFGISHPLIDKYSGELASLLNRFCAQEPKISDNLRINLNRFYDRHLARLNLADEKQRTLQKLYDESFAIEETKTSWLDTLVGGIAILGCISAVASWFRPNPQPTQIFHHHSGHITENINLQHNLHLSGRVREDININWPL